MNYNEPSCINKIYEMHKSRGFKISKLLKVEYENLSL